ncbi:462R [Invertebrate iridescent virus Kaz2018]|uniref:462R n=2 Tax=Iridovirus TaxID=10487 RepID=Q91F64_IIV6|nr:462R [Invertebrate iridescent virus 6]AAK82322.1 462R [Invertebrate iridescent virus 6]QMS79475.1 hypothetical protein IIV6-T1_452 [Invertebrate iridescent virus 6]QNH08872.1 462R [Invertebrate iridescent virus Kaz2018]
MNYILFLRIFCFLIRLAFSSPLLNIVNFSKSDDTNDGFKSGVSFTITIFIFENLYH